MIKQGRITLGHYVMQIQGNIVSNMDDEKVMLSVKNGKYYNLGKIGGCIWDIIHERISVENLVAELVSNYNVAHSKCVEQVITFLEHLYDEELIEINENL